MTPLQLIQVVILFYTKEWIYTYRCLRILPCVWRWMCSWGRRRPRCTSSSVRQYYTTVSQTETICRRYGRTFPSLRQTTIALVHCGARVRETTRSSSPDRTQ